MTPPSDEQERKYRDLAERENRVTMLGFTLGGNPTDADHEEHLKEQHQPTANYAKTKPKPGDKWMLIEGRQGSRAVKVIEDSGTEDNWISPRYLQVLGIPSTEIDPTGHRFINGEILVTTRCARLPLRCKDDRTIEERFLVAPENTPIEIAVGVRFMATYPDAFWNEPPDMATYPTSNASTFSAARQPRNMDQGVEYLAVLGAEGGAHFSIQLEEDIEEELAEFVRLGRLSEFGEACELFNGALRKHLNFFPVLAEYADLLLDQGAYSELSDFLTWQIAQGASRLEPNEMRLLLALLALAHIFTEGALLEAVAEARDCFTLLDSACNTNYDMSNDVEIHLIEIYATIMALQFRAAATASDKDPRIANLRNRLHQWYTILLNGGLIWEASRILKVLLSLTPAESTELSKTAPSHEKFGDEADALGAFEINLSMAHYLLDLTLASSLNSNAERVICRDRAIYHLSEAGKFVKDKQVPAHFWRLRSEDGDYRLARHIPPPAENATWRAWKWTDMLKDAERRHDIRTQVACLLREFVTSPDRPISNLDKIWALQAEHWDGVGFLQTWLLVVALVRGRSSSYPPPPCLLVSERALLLYPVDLSDSERRRLLDYLHAERYDSVISSLETGQQYEAGLEVLRRLHPTPSTTKYEPRKARQPR